MDNKHLLLRRILETVAGKVSIPSGNLLNLFASGRGEDTDRKACRPPTWAILVVLMSQDILWIYVFTFLGFGKVYAGIWLWCDSMLSLWIPKSFLEVFIRCSSKAPTMRTRRLLWMTAKKEEQMKRGGWVLKTSFEKKKKKKAMQLLYCVLCPFGCRRVQHIHYGIIMHQWHWMHHVNGSVFEADGKPRKIPLLRRKNIGGEDISTSWRLGGHNLKVVPCPRICLPEMMNSKVCGLQFVRNQCPGQPSVDWWSWSTCEATSRHPRLSLFPKWGKSWSTIRIVMARKLEI